MRADDDVDPSGSQSFHDVALFARAAEAAEAGNVERELGHPIAKRVEMLFGQDRGRHEHGHLIAAVDGLERRPHGDFGLAEADVAAQQAVHGPRLRACRV